MHTMSPWPLRPAALAAMVLLPLVAMFAGAVRLVPLLMLPLIVLGAPLLIAVRGGWSEGDTGSDDSDSDDGGGGGRRPDGGPTTPAGPVGDLPLEHSSPGRWRQRGNGPQRLSDPGPRRSPHRPVPAPRRVPAGPRH